MKIDPNTDYSSLFSSLGAKDSTSNFLSDYASIKNGSYGKLMKSYYGKNSGSVKNKTNNKVELSEKETQNLSSVKTSADDLKKSIAAITPELIEGEDKDKLYSAVKDFADKYNNLVSNVNTANKSQVTKVAQGMIDELGSNLKTLAKAGITLDTNGKMSVDEDVLKKNTVTLKTLFGSYGSLGEAVSNKASSIQRKAESALNVSKTYTPSASYDNSSYIGKLYDSYN